MKKYYLLAATALAFAACSSDEDSVQTLEKPVAMAFSADIYGANTRVSDEGTAFTQDDEIGIVAIKDNALESTQFNIKYTRGADNSSPEFTATTPYYFQDTQNVTFHAYYPYVSTLTSSSPTISVNTKSEKQTADGRKSNDILFAKLSTTYANPKVNFTGENAFKHQLSRLTLKVKAGNGVSDLSSLTAYKIATNLTLDATFNVQTGTLTAGSTTGNISGTASSVSGTEYSFDPIIIVPQSPTDGKITLELTYNNQTYKTDLNVNDSKFQAGYSYDYTVTINNTGLEVSSASITDWTSKSASGTATLQ